MSWWLTACPAVEVQHVPCLAERAGLTILGGVDS